MGKWILASVIVLLHALAQWMALLDTIDTKAPLAVASIATGILVFVWLLSWGGWPGDDRMPKEARLRAAIAGGIVAQYLSLVAIVTFFPAKEEADMQPITQAFVTSFTAVVTVVIAFYFSASAYVEGRRVKRDGTANDDA